MTTNIRFPVGTKFLHHHTKQITTRTVVDILRTYNTKNELVKVTYVAEHDFNGQKIIDRDVPDSMIARNFLEYPNGEQNFDPGLRVEIFNVRSL